MTDTNEAAEQKLRVERLERKVAEQAQQLADLQTNFKEFVGLVLEHMKNHEALAKSLLERVITLELIEVTSDLHSSFLNSNSDATL